jgi:hypothetical protein
MLNQPIVESNHSDRVLLLVQAPIMANTGRYILVKVESDIVLVTKQMIAAQATWGQRFMAGFYRMLPIRGQL